MAAAAATAATAEVIHTVRRGHLRARRAASSSRACSLSSSTMSAAMRSHSSGGAGSSTGGCAGEDGDGLAQVVDLGAGLRRCLLEVLLDHRALVGLERVEHVRAEQCVHLGAGFDRRHWCTPASMSAARRRSSPDRIRLFTVPSGCSSKHRDLFVGLAAEVRELDGGAFAVRTTSSSACRTASASARSSTSRSRSSSTCGDRSASRCSRARRAFSARSRSTARPCTCAKQERPHRTAFGVVALGLLPHAHEHFLHDFFGEHTVAEDASSEREARRAVALVQLGERPLIALDDRSTEGGVVGVLQVALGEARSGGHATSSAPRSVDGCRRAQDSHWTAPAAASSVTRLPSRTWTPRPRFARSSTSTRRTAAIPTTGTGVWPPAGYVAPHWPRPVGSRRDADRATRDRRGAAGAAGAASHEPDRHRLGRPDLARRRHRGAAAALPAGHPRRLRALVPVVQRAGRGQRPRVAADARRARRRRVRRERAEGLDDARARRRATASCSPAPNPTPERARRHHVLRPRHAVAGHRGATARADDRHARVQRGVLHRRARARRERGRYGRRRLAARQGHARQRTRVALGRRRALGSRPDRTTR